MKPISEFRWTEQAHGDSYILNERSYDCLFRTSGSLAASDRWLDIGAHVGYFSVRIARLVDQVVSVEPEPLNFQHLLENRELNNVLNMVPVQAAVVPDDRTTVLLGLGKTFTYTHKVGKTRGRQHITVPAVHVNNLIEDYKLNKIKMDCEGMEPYLLAVMNLEPIQEIILEWHFTLIPDPDWRKLKSVLWMLEGNGFEILRAPADLGNPTKRWTAIIWARRP